MNATRQKDEHGIFWRCELCLEPHESITDGMKCCSQAVYQGSEPERMVEKPKKAKADPFPDVVFGRNYLGGIH